MAIDVQNPPEQSLTSLLGGIVNDFQDLVKQQLRLTRQEIVGDLRKGKEAAGFLVAGLMACLIGTFAFVMALGYLLHWLGMPAGADPSSLPLWGSFAIVTAFFWLVSGALIMAAKKKMETLSSPLNETARGLKENIEWKTNPTRS